MPRQRRNGIPGSGIMVVYSSFFDRLRGQQGRQT